MRLLFPLVALFASGNLLAQTQASATEAEPKKERKFALKNPDMKLEPFAQLQGWAVYSSGRAAENDNTAGLDKADNRTNFFFRRARIGFRGQPYKDLSYTLSMYYDNAGHDSQASTRALTSPSVNGTTGTSVGGMATVGLWDSFLSWKISNSDIFHATFGYFRPQISRESLTAAFNVNSFEKAVSQNYVRQSVIGRGFGRGTGVNFGGLSEDKKFNYNIGFFNKNTTGEKVGSNTLGETQGSTANSLVYVARAAYSFGDPEMSKYSTSYITNYFGKRKGLTLALNGSSQDRTPLYKDNKVIGGDILYNWGNFNLDGEFFYIYKKNLGSDNFTRARTGHLRMGYLFFLDNDTIIEPAVMVSAFYGDKGADYTGRDTTYDVGVNWYLDQNRYKFYVHYVGQSGDGNNLENKPGANGYHYGNYAGAGVTLQI